jgi:hypothetical protein
MEVGSDIPFEEGALSRDYILVSKLARSRIREALPGKLAGKGGTRRREARQLQVDHPSSIPRACSMRKELRLYG